ncbi:hypothetical protein SUGI_1518660, partial [Cryptomeria japonica]
GSVSPGDIDSEVYPASPSVRAPPCESVSVSPLPESVSVCNIEGRRGRGGRPGRGLDSRSSLRTSEEESRYWDPMDAGMEVPQVVIEAFREGYGPALNSRHCL